MEDLLANIRKAIDAESGVRGAARGGEAMIGGSMREMRVRLEDTPRPVHAPDKRAAEILELRSRVSGLAAVTSEPARPQAAAPVAAPRNAGFASILAAEPVAPRQPAMIEIEVAPEPEPPVEAPHWPAPAEPEPPQEPWINPAEAYLPRFASRSPQPPAHAPRRHAEESVLSHDTATATHAAFNRLADTLMARATGERPIEDVTRELLRGMLKQWLDEHLPGLVERIVREEIERVARRGPVR